MVATTDEQCRFAVVPEVTIEGVDAVAVRFSTRATRGTGKPDDNLRKTFTVPRTEVYAAPIPGAPSAPVPLKPGAIGALYLSRTGWQATTPDGYEIHGRQQAIYKWPTCAGIPTPLRAALEVVPTSILVRGHREGDDVFFELELLGPEASDAQAIRWAGGNHVELHLTDAGAQRIGAATAGPVRVWPTRIVVQGSPAFDLSLDGEVDLLDGELACSEQVIAYAQRGAPIRLALTQDGVNAFHVTPQLAAEHALRPRSAQQPETPRAIALTRSP